MKKLLIIGLLLVALFMTGCGLFYLTNWTMPDDLEFYQVVMELDTPQKICGYLEENFTFTTNLLYAPSPYEFWKAKEGDCNDFETFGRFVAYQHGITTYKAYLYLRNTLYTHTMAVYVELNLYNYQDANKYHPIWVDNFRAIVEHWQTTEHRYQWTSYKIYDWDNNLIERGVR